MSRFFVSRPARRSLLRIFLVFLLVLVAEPLRHAALTVLRFPFAVVKGCVGTLTTLPSLPALTREHERLRTELMQRQAEVARLREQLRQAQQSAALLKDAPTPRAMIASLIGRSTIPTQQTVLLDRGRADGLALNGVILDATGVVGRIAELQSRTSLVRLLTDSESRVGGIIERSREAGLLVGRGGGSCELIYLDAHADVIVGDHVLTAGLGGDVPKGLPLGEVVRVLKDEEAGTASAWVRPAARLGQLEDVLCLLP